MKVMWNKSPKKGHLPSPDQALPECLEHNGDPMAMDPMDPMDLPMPKELDPATELERGNPKTKRILNQTGGIFRSHPWFNSTDLLSW